MGDSDEDAEAPSQSAPWDDDGGSQRGGGPPASEVAPFRGSGMSDAEVLSAAAAIRSRRQPVLKVRRGGMDCLTGRGCVVAHRPGMVLPVSSTACLSLPLFPLLTESVRFRSNPL